MKSRSLIFTIAAVAALPLACGGSDDSAGAGGGGTTSTTSASSASTSSTGTSTSTSSTTGAGGGPALTCDDYCAEVMANCVAANQQYVDAEHCEAVCASFPAGELGDVSGDTLGCRIYHGGAAAADPATHCGHAGPSGGDQDPADAAPGPCGDACEAFCDLAQASCTAANSQYADDAACLADCKTFAPSAAAFDVSDASSNDYNCRLYHLTAAALDPAGHCAHVTSSSPVCTM